MKTLDLYRIWEILNFISEQENLLNEKDIYPDLLGNMSCYYIQGFDYFIEHYSFRIDKDEICIFNDDQIPYEDYTTSDFSYIPKKLLSFNDYGYLTSWVREETEAHLKKEEENKNKEKKDLEDKIKLLTQRLEKLCE
jgi:hypothetical protein